MFYPMNTEAEVEMRQAMSEIQMKMTNGASLDDGFEEVKMVLFS